MSCALLLAFSNLLCFLCLNPQNFRGFSFQNELAALLISAVTFTIHIQKIPTEMNVKSLIWKIVISPFLSWLTLSGLLKLMKTQVNFNLHRPILTHNTSLPFPSTTYPTANLNKNKCKVWIQGSNQLSAFWLEIFHSPRSGGVFRYPVFSTGFWESRCVT